MRKTGFFALLLAGLLLLSSCSGNGVSYLYGDGGHIHVYGEWYDVTPVNCLVEGEHICFCKICGESYTEKIPVAVDDAAKKHDFEDTVTAPTEAMEGFTRRVCRLCGYVVERADVIPARFHLPLPEGELILAENLTAQLFFNTVRGDNGGVGVFGAQNTDVLVSARPALFLASALITAEAVAAGEVSFDERLEVRAKHLAGRDPGALEEGITVSVRELVKLCLTGSGADAAVAMLAERLCGGNAEFAERLNARMAVLGVKNTLFSGIDGEVGKTTLADTAVLLWRVLETASLDELASRGIAFGKNGEKPCAVSLTAGDFRLVAVRVTAAPDGGNGASVSDGKSGASVPDGKSDASGFDGANPDGYFEILAIVASPLPSIPSLGIL